MSHGVPFFGIGEFLVMIPIFIISLAIPVAALVGVFLIYGSLRRIEKLLGQRE